MFKRSHDDTGDSRDSSNKRTRSDSTIWPELVNELLEKQQMESALPPLPLSRLQNLLRQLKPQDESAQQQLQQKLLEIEKKQEEFEEKGKEFEKQWFDAQQQPLPPNFSFRRVIDAKQKTLTFQELRPLCVGLKRNMQIESLNLYGIPLDDLGIYCLAEALAENTFLTFLCLGNAKHSDFSAYCLGKALARNTTLSKLEIFSNNITPVGFYFLSCLLAVNSSLKNIVLAGNKINSDPMGGLYLSAGILENSQNGGVLSVLNLYETALGDEGSAALALALKENPPLVSLDIGSCGISFEGFRKFSEALICNNTLESFAVWRNQLGKGIEMLSSFGALTKLNLDDAGIDDSAACAVSNVLASNTVLTYLNLGVNPFTNKGVAALTVALETNTTLQSLILYRMEAALIALALKRNCTLELLNLCTNKIGELPSRMQAPADLSLSAPLPFYREDFWVLCQMSFSLSTIFLNDNALGDEGACDLAQVLLVNTVLTYCNLMANGIGDLGIAALAIALRKNNVLRSLVLRNNPIGDAGITDLVSSLRQNTGLRGLELGGNEFGEPGAKALLSLSLFKENTQTPINTVLTVISLPKEIPVELVKSMGLFCQGNRSLSENREGITLRGLCDKQVHADLQLRR